MAANTGGFLNWIGKNYKSIFRSKGVILATIAVPGLIAYFTYFRPYLKRVKLNRFGAEVDELLKGRGQDRQQDEKIDN